MTPCAGISRCLDRKWLAVGWADVRIRPSYLHANARGRSPEVQRDLPLTPAAQFHAIDRSNGMARKSDGDLHKTRPGSLPPLHEIADDTPLRLNVAAALAY